MNKSIFLSTEDCYLRPYEEADQAYAYYWDNDAITRGKIGEKRPSSEQDVRDRMTARTRQDSIWFSIVLKENDEVIGETGFLRMDPDNGCSDFSIIIANPQHQHQGYGKQVVSMMFAYAFLHLRMHRLAIGVVDFNTEALRFYERVGFQKEGVWEESYYYDGRYHDFIMMRILKQDYEASDQ